MCASPDIAHMHGGQLSARWRGQVRSRGVQLAVCAQTVRTRRLCISIQISKRILQRHNLLGLIY